MLIPYQGNRTLFAQLLRTSRGILLKLEHSSDKGELRTLTQLIPDVSEVRLTFLLAFATYANRRLFPRESSHLALYLIWSNSLPTSSAHYFSSSIHSFSTVMRCTSPVVRALEGEHRVEGKQGLLKTIFDDVSEKGRAGKEGKGLQRFTSLRGV